MHSAPVDLLKIQLSVGIDVYNGILEYAPHLFTYSFWSLAIRDTDCAEEEDATKLKVYFDRGLDVNSDEGMPKAFRNIKATHYSACGNHMQIARYHPLHARHESRL